MSNKIKRLLIMLAMIISLSAIAETVHYGVYTRLVDIRNDDPTLLIFDSAPLSAACHPADLLSFELLSQDGLTELENLQVRSRSSNSKPSNSAHEDMTSRMIRVRPEGKSGEVRCSFPLANGDNIGVVMRLGSDIVRPLIHFKSITSNQDFSQDKGNQPLSLLRSLFLGKPLGLLNETKNYPRRINSDLAKYRIRYVGTDGMYRAIKISGTAHEKISSEKLSVLLLPTGVGLYSSVIPLRNIEEDEQFTLLLVAKHSLSPSELRRALR